MGRITFRNVERLRKVPFSVSLEDKYIEFLRKKPNRSDFIRKLLDEAMKKETTPPTEEVKEKKTEETKKIKLSNMEFSAYTFAIPKIEEFNYLLYGSNYENMGFSIDRDPEFLKGYFRDIRDSFSVALENVEEHLEEPSESGGSVPKLRVDHPAVWFSTTIEESKKIYEYLKEVVRNEEIFDDLFEKIKRRWIEKHPIPEEFKKGIVPGWSLADLIKKLGSNEHKTFTVHDVAGVLGVSYQQAYNSVRPILEKHGYRFVKKGQRD